MMFISYLLQETVLGTIRFPLVGTALQNRTVHIVVGLVTAHTIFHGTCKLQDAHLDNAQIP